MNDDANDVLGATIREARRRHGVSLRSLAAELGVSASLLSQIETGKTQASVRTLFALSHRLDFSIDEIVERIMPTARRNDERESTGGQPGV